MSDEEQGEHEGPREGESGHEWMQRMASPELRWLDLFHRLNARVEANESRAGASEEEARRREVRIQGNIESILQQQAQFGEGMQQLREAQARAEERWKRAEERWDRAEEKWDRMWERTNGQINDLRDIAEIQSGEISTLAQAQMTQAQALTQLLQAHSQLAQTLAQIAESQANTDRQMAGTNERLNALINVVERIIGERRNGG